MGMGMRVDVGVHVHVLCVLLCACLCAQCVHVCVCVCAPVCTCMPVPHPVPPYFLSSLASPAILPPHACLPPPRTGLHRLDRPLYLLFWQRLLSSGVRTTNGEEADYYFIPIKMRMGYDG